MSVPVVVKVTEAPGSGLWLVASRSTAGAYWLVRLGSLPGCTCPYGRSTDVDALRSRPCHHIKEASAEEARRQPPPRPSAPPNIAALVE